MQPHQIVSRQEWIEARKAHMAHEKELTRARDRLSEERRAAALGQGRQGLRIRRAERQGHARRSVQGPEPARGAACHVRARMGRGLQELFVLGRRFRAHGPASRRARHHHGRGLARAARKARGVQEADGLDASTGSRPATTTSTTTTAFRSRREQIDAGDAKLQFRHHAALRSRSCPASACSIATRPATSSTPIPAIARGLDMMNAAYHYLDLTPLGRHEEGLPYPMDWVRLRDQYQPEARRRRAARVRTGLRDGVAGLSSYPFETTPSAPLRIRRATSTMVAGSYRFARPPARSRCRKSAACRRAHCRRCRRS